MGLISSPETSASNNPTPRNNPKDIWIQFNSGRSLRSHILQFCLSESTADWSSHISHTTLGIATCVFSAFQDGRPITVADTCPLQVTTPYCLDRLCCQKYWQTVILSWITWWTTMTTQSSTKIPLQYTQYLSRMIILYCKGKCKAFQLQAWTGL